MNRGKRMAHRVLNVMTYMLVTCSVLICADDETFCQENTSQTNKTGLHFTKDWSTIDYVLVERHKALHCCVEEYKTIEWYKDGHQIIYNFTNGTSFRLAKGSDNTRIFTDSAIKLDNGIYTCVASNGTLTLKHVVELYTDIEMNYEGPARWTGIPKDQYAQIGESASFFCEGFIGPGNDTNQDSQVIWMKKGESYFPKGFTEVNSASYVVFDCCAYAHIGEGWGGRRDCQVERALLISQCRLWYDPHTKIRTTYKATLILLLVFSAAIILMALSTMKWHLEIRLFLKDRFGKLEEDDEKEYDAFVCYDQDDTDFALGVLVPTLEQKYHYHCFAYERDCNAGDVIPETYSTHVNTSRRFIMVLSPSLARNKWCTYALYMAIEAMLNLHSKIICIILQRAGTYRPRLFWRVIVYSPREFKRARYYRPRAFKSKSLPSKGLQESKILPSQGLQESKSLPSQGLQESKSLPSKGRQESKCLPSQNLQESKILPSQGLQESKSSQSKGLQESKILPSKGHQESKCSQSKGLQESKILPSKGRQESKNLPSKGH
uniref:Ig-like domain-containing protein n=1 Tax=Timema monikensis TaxID=170555 RepID=A0A7R9EC50_9NEOP|nr:unnamed protein product [Timema monikensis]